MNTLHPLRQEHRKQSGQTLALFAIMALALLLVAGLCVDAGTIYLAKAELDKAVDAASLTIVRNLFQGQTVATTVGQAAFTANYRSEGYVTNAPVLNITYATDANSNTTVTILGTATVSPYFMRLVPRFGAFQISSGATATRAKLIMSLVLDISGSLQSNGGSTTMPSAAKNFISYFDDTMDRVALVTFSSTTNLNVSIRQPFKSAITTAINSISFGGATYTDGGLQLALQQNSTIVVSTNENVIKVVVLFTDGYANTFQYLWTNSNHQVEVYNVGGYDPNQNTYAILNPTTGSQITPPHNSSTFSGPVPSNGSPYDMPNNKFMSIDGTNTTITGTSFSVEGALRAASTANTIRNSNTFVYCIGFGSDVDSTFLASLANDPTASTFNPNQPIGAYIQASTTADLQTAFLDIASKILLRLTR